VFIPQLLIIYKQLTFPSDICDEIFWRRRNSKSTVADILAIIGTLDKISDKTDYYNEAAIWHYRQLLIQKVPATGSRKSRKLKQHLRNPKTSLTASCERNWDRNKHLSMLLK
jgi:hypothetical protein